MVMQLVCTFGRLLQNKQHLCFSRHLWKLQYKHTDKITIAQDLICNFTCIFGHHVWQQNQFATKISAAEVAAATTKTTTKILLEHIVGESHMNTSILWVSPEICHEDDCMHTKSTFQYHGHQSKMTNEGLLNMCFLRNIGIRGSWLWAPMHRDTDRTCAAAKT